MMDRLEYVQVGKLEWREAPEPTLHGDGEALVRPIAVATCDIDPLIVRGKVPVEGPFAFGHECVAEVIDVGDAVAGCAVGDIVSVPFQISCGECANCRRGRTANCTSVPPLSMYGLGPLSGRDVGGFLGELAGVPFADHMLLPIPTGVDPLAVASMSDNIADAWRTVAAPLLDEPAAEVLIVGGQGSVGLYAVDIAVALGASRVNWVGGRDRQHDLARQLGAHVIEGPYPERLGPYPITVDASGDVAGLGCAIRSTGPDGTCTSIGIYFDLATPVPLLEMYMKGIRFQTGRVHARTAMPRVLELVRDGRLRPELVTHRVVSWDDAAAAIAEHDAKLVITRPATSRR